MQLLCTRIMQVVRINITADFISNDRSVTVHSPHQELFLLRKCESAGGIFRNGLTFDYFH